MSVHAEQRSSVGGWAVTGLASGDGRQAMVIRKGNIITASDGAGALLFPPVRVGKTRDSFSQPLFVDVNGDRLLETVIASRGIGPAKVYVIDGTLASGSTVRGRKVPRGQTCTAAGAVPLRLAYHGSPRTPVLSIDPACDDSALDASTGGNTPLMRTASGGYFCIYPWFCGGWSNNDNSSHHNDDHDNSAPVVNPIPAQTVAALDELRFSVTASDPDGDTMYLKWNSPAPSGASLNLQTGQFYWKPRTDQVGQYQVSFLVKDSHGAQSSVSVSITVTPHINTAPVIFPIGDKAVKPGDTLAFTISASDAEGDVMYLSWKNPPPGASLNMRTGDFSWRPTEQMIGTYRVTFEVTDTFQAMSTETITITVATGPNSPPVVTPIPDQSVQTGQYLTFTVQAYDPDGDIMYLSHKGLPPGATLDLRWGVFRWTPAADQAGSYQIALEVTDRKNAPVPMTVNITVGAQRL